MTEADTFKALTAWDDRDGFVLVGKKQDATGQLKRCIRRIDDAQWYFVIRAIDKEKIQPLLDDYWQLGIILQLDLYKTEWLKIYVTKQPRFVDRTMYSYRTLLDQIRAQHVKLYEADLSNWKRYIIDNHIEVADKLDILYFDIETDDSKHGIEIGRDRIISWAAIDMAGKTYFAINESVDSLDETTNDAAEKKLLEELLNVFHKYDLLGGWNSSGFDIPYIVARAERLHIPVADFLKKKLHVDMMQRCARVYSFDMFNIGLKGFSLNEVCRVFLNGEQKVEHSQSILDMWKHNKELLKEYNIKDVDLLRRLDEKILVTNLMIKECAWTGAFMNRFFIGELLDNYILRRTHDLGFFQPERPGYAQAEELEDVSVRGGYVMSPVTGVYENVRVCDFKSLYPSIMVGFNIGKDSLNEEMSDQGTAALEKLLATKDCKVEDLDFDEWRAFLASEKARLDPGDTCIQAANNSYYYRDKTSFVGALVKQLLDLRAQWKAQAKGMSRDDSRYVNIQQSQGMVKEMANSMFGITCDKSSRYFDKRVAEAITLTGQFVNRLSASYVRNYGYTVFYGDTDSIFLPVDRDEAMDKLIIDVNTDIRNWLNDDVKSKDNIMLLQYEKKFSRLIMLDKKRYTGRMVVYDGQPTDKLFSRGTENIKKSTIKLAREAIIKLINLILEDRLTQSQAIEWVRSLKHDVLFAQHTPEELVMIIKVSKPTTSYVAKSLHVRLADRLIKEGKLLQIVEGKRTWGTRLEYIVVRMPDGSQEGVQLDEYQGNWDSTYYWDVQIYAPIRRMLECRFPEHDWTEFEIASSEQRLQNALKKETRLLKIITNDAIRQQKMTDKLLKRAEKLQMTAEQAVAKRVALKKKVISKLASK